MRHIDDLYEYGEAIAEASILWVHTHQQDVQNIRNMIGDCDQKLDQLIALISQDFDDQSVAEDVAAEVQCRQKLFDNLPECAED